MSFLTIGCGGQAATGKDTVCDYLIKVLGNNWVKNGFAYALKDIFCSIFGVNKEFLEYYKRIDDIPEGFIKNMRDSLILIGDGCRQINANIWIELAFRNQISNQCLCDIRYRNESKYIRKKGGFTVLLWRPGFENDIPSPSEQELMPYVRKLREMKPIPEGLINFDDIPFDAFLVNDGTLEDLYAKIDHFLVPKIKELELNSSQDKI